MVEKNMRYFACRGEPRYPAITRFVGESGMIYGSDGSSCEANQNLRWHEENEPEVTEDEAINIVGGKRPWEPEPQSPATTARYFLGAYSNECVRRFVGNSGCIYFKDGSFKETPRDLDWHIKNFRETTEATAINIVGGRPWETQSPATAVQPAPTPTSGRPVWEMVIEDMHARNRFGTEKHGTPLQVDNGRDKLTDLYQEGLDKLVYMRAWIEQRNAAVALLRESKQFCGTKTSEMIDQAIAMLMGGGK